MPTLSHVFTSTSTCPDCWSPLNDSATYSVATNSYIAGGGGGFEMFEALPGERLGLSFDAVVDYLSATSPYSVDADRIIQQPSLIEIEVGIVCETDEAGGTESPRAREECDHIHHLIDRLNDKTDGFFDELLVNAVIHTAEAQIGCVSTPPKGPSAIAELQAALPNMIAVVGSICSNDVADISNVAFRAQAHWAGIVISGSSTAPSLADEVAYPLVARLATSERFVGNASALLAKLFSWSRVAVIHDDSQWATEGARAFIAAHLSRPGASATDIINEGDGVTQGFSVAAFDSDTEDEAIVRAVEVLRRLEEFDCRVVYMVPSPHMRTTVHLHITTRTRTRMYTTWQVRVVHMVAQPAGPDGIWHSAGGAAAHPAPPLLRELHIRPGARRRLRVDLGLAVGGGLPA